MISCFILIMLQACLAIFLTRRLGTGTGLLLHILTMLVFSGIGWLLLTQLTTETITWRNRAIGVLMPWPNIVGGGSLVAYVFKNTIASTVFALIVVAVDRYQVFSMPIETQTRRDHSIGSWLIAVPTFFCWIALCVGWLWMLQSTLANRPDNLSSLPNLRGIAVPLLLPPILVVTSIALRYNGHSTASMLTVAVPVFLVLMPVLLMMGVILFHYITGKPMRWN